MPQGNVILRHNWMTMIKKHKRQAGLVDVARVARVSVSTAGRVLRDSDYPVDPKLITRVKKAAGKLGYTPNLLARQLRGGEHAFIGLIVGNMEDPFYGQIAQSVTDRANSKALMAIVANMQRDSKMEIDLCEKLWERRISGLILSGGGFDQLEHQNELVEAVNRLRKAGVVVVSLAERDLRVPCFSVDNFEAGRLAAKHVLDLGHREIGIVAGPVRSLVSERRLAGKLAALSEAGIVPVVVRSTFGLAPGAHVLDLVLEKNPKTTEVVAAGDTLALGVIRRFHERGGRVPDGLSVVGIGNTFYAQLSSPRMSTVDIGLSYCGAAAVDFLVEALGGGSPPQPEKYQARLVPGDSVRRFARAAWESKADGHPPSHRNQEA